MNNITLWFWQVIIVCTDGAAWDRRTFLHWKGDSWQQRTSFSLPRCLLFFIMFFDYAALVFFSTLTKIESPDFLLTGFSFIYLFIYL